ncbi:MAG: hypothetical protein ACI8PT_002700 [Gammaproteobacteria bacterium]|jgi:hypothetical protein
MLLAHESQGHVMTCDGKQVLLGIVVGLGLCRHWPTHNFTKRMKRAPRLPMGLRARVGKSVSITGSAFRY